MGDRKQRNKMEDTRSSSNKKRMIANIKVKSEAPQQSIDTIISDDQQHQFRTEI